MQHFSEIILSSIILLPMLGSAAIAFLHRSSENSISLIARVIAKLSLIATLTGFGVWLLGQETLRLVQGLHHPYFPVDIHLQLNYDGVSAVFTLLTSFFLLVIVRFSRVYLHREPGYGRFFSVLLLLATGMQVMSLADNLVIFFFGWELVGIASYFLVSFYRLRERSAANAYKVMSVYRVGDLGLILGIVFFHLIPGIPAESALSQLLLQETFPSIGLMYLLPIGIGVALAAAAKSAQFPFTFWLPKAMEGPTPSSAIFYGALSVHAGALLLLRLQPLWSQVPFLPTAIGAIGGLTALLATGSSRVQPSIKGQLAYSSAAQVGIIFVELSLGWTTFALYHIICHALIRAFQLLISPSIISRYMLLQSSEAGALRMSSWSIERLLPPRLRSTLYVLALQDNFLEHMIDTILIQRLKHASAPVWATLASLATLVVGIAAAIYIEHGRSQIMASALATQALISAILALNQKESPLRTIDLLGVTLLLAAIATIVVDIADWQKTVAGIALMLPFWIHLRWLMSTCTPSLRLDAYSGLYDTSPWAAWCILISLGALSGLPPLPGFFFEDYALVRLLDASPLVCIITALALCLNSIAAFRLFTLVTMGKPINRSYNRVPKAECGTVAAMSAVE